MPGINHGTPSKRLPATDVVIVGSGWAGGIISAELAASSLRVVTLERGPDRPDDDPAFTSPHDELRYRIRGDLMQDTALETWTHRHHMRETALPVRYLGAFRPGTGVGGSSIHYGGQALRYLPSDFALRSRTLERYGDSHLPAEATLADWGITYEDLEPDYGTFERTAGVAGKAGNLRGSIRSGGNPFEGPRRQEFPLPPLEPGSGQLLFREATEKLGLHPFFHAGAVLPRPYDNGDGRLRNACVACGDCAFHACAVGAKGDSRSTVLPIAFRSPTFELRANSNVFKVLHDGRKATGVLYYDADGNVCQQPAEMVVLAAYCLNNVRLLLLSGLGRQFDPQSGEGVVGRNYSFQAVTTAMGLFADRTFDRTTGSQSAGFSIDDYNSDNFDHSDLDFIGGALIQCSMEGASPITGLVVPPGTPRWGLEWKRAIGHWYTRAVKLTGVVDGLAYQSHYLDLDPTYRDAWGSPLLRITFDWGANERRIVPYIAHRMAEILTAMGAKHVASVKELPEHFDTVTYQSTHNTGGAIMGHDMGTSVINPHLQMWDVENVWVVGGNAFPQCPGRGPTGTIGAVAYRAASGIKRYARNPGPLA